MVNADIRRRDQVEFMLAHDPSECFEVRKDALAYLRPATRIGESLPCDSCGEMMMSTRLRLRENRNVCTHCHEDARKDRDTL